MLTGVCFGANDLSAAGRFYDEVLGAVGLVRRFQNEREIGYGKVGQDAQFWILKPFDEQPASCGNGTQVMFKAASQEEVRAFHTAALAQGGRDEGKPGIRDYQPGYYGAYCRDLDGNKLHVYLIETN